tara:strand:+ start:551 stop:973 length:423 start_codon:yes stop_codon:yes gene_type:complete
MPSEKALAAIVLLQLELLTDSVRNHLAEIPDPPLGDRPIGPILAAIDEKILEHAGDLNSKYFKACLLEATGMFHEFGLKTTYEISAYMIPSKFAQLLKSRISSSYVHIFNFEKDVPEDKNIEDYTLAVTNAIFEAGVFDA